MPLWFLDAIGWLVAHKRIAVGICIALLLIFVAGYVHFCMPSRLERKIESENPVVIESEQVANQSVRESDNAVTEAKNAQKEVKKVQKNKQKGVTLDEANKNRCLAFPDSEGCQ